jgi:hypothetical protein
VKGYEDPFALDFGWTTGGSCGIGHGVFIRVDPDNITSGGVQITPFVDDQTDIGTQCMLTGSGGGQPGTDDLDGCDAMVISPLFDLTSSNDPHIKFDYWFQSLAQNGATPDDKFWVILNNGIEIDTVFSTPTPAAVWHNDIDLRIKDFQQPTANMRITYRAIDRGVNHWVKAAVDNFRVYEFVGTQAQTTANIGFATQPNPFGNNTTLQYHLDETLGNTATLHIYNSLGQEVQTTALPQSIGTLQIGENLPSGAYMVRIAQNGKMSVAQRIVKM